MNKDIVENTESVARVLFSPSYLDGENRISPTAFRLDRLPSGACEDYISVFRWNESCDLLEVSRELRPRKSGDSNYGYVVMSVADIRDLNGVWQM